MATLQSPALRGCVLLSFAGLFSASNADSAILASGNVLRVTFTYDGGGEPWTPEPCAVSGCPTAALVFGVYTTMDLFSAGRAALYDGPVLLGITDQPFMFPVPDGSAAAVWLDSDAIFPIPPPWYPAFVDFTSIRNGTIQGRIDYTMPGGSLELFEPLENAVFVYAYAGTEAGYVPIGQVDITSAAIIPEPGSVALFAAGLILLLWRRKHRHCHLAKHST